MPIAFQLSEEPLQHGITARIPFIHLAHPHHYLLTREQDLQLLENIRYEAWL